MAFKIGAVELLQESIIKIEEIKEEPADSVANLNFENYIAVKTEPDTDVSSVPILNEIKQQSDTSSVKEGENGLKIIDVQILVSRKHGRGQMEHEGLAGYDPQEHEKTKRPWGCTVCQRHFSQKANLIRHLKTHCGHKPFRCHVCKRTFSRKEHLATHVRSHTGWKPFACTSCKKQFSCKKDLAVHIRTHTQEKPYGCTVCSKTFTQKGNLDRHLRIHTGEKPYSCAVCSKCFAHNRDLVRHKLTHTGKKPYKCSVCQKRFRCKHHLVRHIPRHDI